MSKRKVRVLAALAATLACSAVARPVLAAAARPPAAETVITLKQQEEALRTQIRTLAVKPSYCQNDYTAVRAQLDFWANAARTLAAARQAQMGQLLGVREYYNRNGLLVPVNDLRVGQGGAMQDINLKYAELARARVVACIANHSALMIPSTRAVGQSLQAAGPPRTAAAGGGNPNTITIYTAR
jgi:hypothetical protein